MNNVFKKKNKIELSADYYIETDGNNGICLVYHQVRERKKKNSEELEDYLFEDRTYHNRLTQALTTYCDLTENASKDIQELVVQVKYNKDLLEKIDREFNQFN